VPAGSGSPPRASARSGKESAVDDDYASTAREPAVIPEPLTGVHPSCGLLIERPIDGWRGARERGSQRGARAKRAGCDAGDLHRTELLEHRVVSNDGSHAMGEQHRDGFETS
jgi:hypothetical protein